MSQWVIITAVVIVVVLLTYLIYYTYTLQKPAKGSCDYIKARDPTIKWSKDCSFIEETSLDTSLKTPTEPLFLGAFTHAPGMGNPWGANVWYRYNYVDGKTGKYSSPSPWTPSPITAGSSTLPCLHGNCSTMKNSGKDSCTSNLATLSLSSPLDYGVSSGIYANVHRYVAPLNNTTPPTSNTPGKIVGMLTPSGSSVLFIDTSESPCKDVSCTNVKGC